MTQLQAQPGESRAGEPQPGGLTLAAARFFAARLAASWVPRYLAGRGFGDQMPVSYTHLTLPTKA